MKTAAPQVYFHHPNLPVDPRDTYRYLAQQQKAIDELIFQLNRVFQINSLTNAPTNPGVNTDYQFANSISGMVLVGRPNSTLSRLYVDKDGEDVIYGLEDVTSIQSGDIVFNSSSCGPVLLGKQNNGIFRFYVNDSDINARILGIEKLLNTSAITSHDLWFNHNGFGWINLSRSAGTKWLWQVNDEDSLDGVFSLEAWP
jgi:hypothetical protein